MFSYTCDLAPGFALDLARLSSCYCFVFVNTPSIFLLVLSFVRISISRSQHRFAVARFLLLFGARDTVDRTLQEVHLQHHYLRPFLKIFMDLVPAKDPSDRSWMGKDVEQRKELRSFWDEFRWQHQQRLKDAKIRYDKRLICIFTFSYMHFAVGAFVPLHLRLANWPRSRASEKNILEADAHRRPQLESAKF